MVLLGGGERSLTKRVPDTTFTGGQPIREKELVEHNHILKWGNLERIIYCKNENCDYVIDAIEILKIVKSYEDFINTNTLPLTNTE